MVFNQKEYMREYNSRPEIKKRKKEYDRKYNSRPEVKERKKESYSKPEYQKYKKEYQKNWAQSFEGKLSIVKSRSKKKNLEFNLTIEYLKSIYPKNNMCPLLNIPLDWKSSYKHPNTPSLDRIDSSKGYIKGNVQWVSWRANQLMSNATPDELLMLAQNYKKIYDRMKSNDTKHTSFPNDFGINME